MNIVIWITIGTLLGIIFSKKTKMNTHTGNTVYLGLFGALIGGLIASVLGQVPLMTFDFHTTFIASMGALTLLWIGKSII